MINNIITGTIGLFIICGKVYNYILKYLNKTHDFLKICEKQIYNYVSKFIIPQYIIISNTDALIHYACMKLLHNDKSSIFALNSSSNQLDVLNGCYEIDKTKLPMYSFKTPIYIQKNENDLKLFSYKNSKQELQEWSLIVKNHYILSGNLIILWYCNTSNWELPIIRESQIKNYLTNSMNVVIDEFDNTHQFQTNIGYYIQQIEGNVLASNILIENIATKYLRQIYMMKLRYDMTIIDFQNLIQAVPEKSIIVFEHIVESINQYNNLKLTDILSILNPTNISYGTLLIWIGPEFDNKKDLFNDVSKDSIINKHFFI